MTTAPNYRPYATALQGSIQHIQHHSNVLQGNPWNDPAERTLTVYLPPGYKQESGPYPVLWDLAAYTNSGLGHVNWRNHGENLPQRLDRLITSGAMPPAICVFPDCYTSLGGNQYVNSPAIGDYASYLTQELYPLINDRFATTPGPDGHALFGKSSGGYGAIYLACHHPGYWGAIAAHAPDVGFDRVYLPDFPGTCSTLAPFAKDLKQFVKTFWSRKQPKGNEFHTMMVLCLACSYHPNLDRPGEIQLPFRLDTCELDLPAWQHWLAFDPLNMIQQHTEPLQSLRHFWLDVGSRDQYNIQFGSRQLSRDMKHLSIEHHFEEFDGTHSGIDWRLDHSLPALLEALISSSK